MSATVTSVQEIGNRGGSKSSVFAKDERRMRYFLVQLNQPSSTADDDVLAIAGNSSPGPDTLPLRGDAHPNWTTLVALTLTPVPESGDEAAVNWTVAVEYGINILNISYPPWQWLDRRSSGVVEYSRIMSRDFSTVDANGFPVGNFICNTAGDPFYPPVNYTLHNQLLTVTRARRYADFVPDQADAVIGTINSSSFSIRGVTYAAESCLMKSITWHDEAYNNSTNANTSYYEITLQIEVQRQVELKKLWLANIGLYALDPSGNKYRITLPAKDTNGNLLGKQPVSTPQYLNADGTLFTGAPGGQTEVAFQKATVKDWTNAIT